jgi:predicted acyltransferase
MSSAPGATPAGARLLSLDALRGFDMFWILGGDALAYALHVEWAGVHFYDLIFPLFVFLMGVSAVFSLSRILERDGRPAAIRRVLVRGLLLFALGVVYNGGLASPWPDVRIMGVLGRIALCYTFAGLLFCFLRTRGLAVVTAVLLLGYWALLAEVPFPDVRPVPGMGVITQEAGFTKVSQLRMDSPVRIKGSYIQGVTLTNYLDQQYLPGRKYDGTYDPEGLLSTLPAFGTALLGLLAGLQLRRDDLSAPRKAARLLGAGVVTFALGLLWGLEFPIIKKIWTSSYVLVAGGYAAAMLGLFHWLIEVRQWRSWCLPFVWIGMNPITLYLGDALLHGYGGVAERLVGGSVAGFLDAHVAAGAGNLGVALVGVLLFGLVARFLYRRQIFLRV